LCCIDLGDLTVHDGATDIGARNPTLQKALQRMLVPLDVSLCRSFAQHANSGQASYSRRVWHAPHELTQGGACSFVLRGFIFAREFPLKLVQGRQQCRDSLSEAG
jgi:hypothetical protein